MTTRQATAQWNGTLKEGNGLMRYGEFEGPFTFASRWTLATRSSLRMMSSARRSPTASRRIEISSRSMRGFLTQARSVLPPIEVSVLSSTLMSEASASWGFKGARISRLARDSLSRSTSSCSAKPALYNSVVS